MNTVTHNRSIWRRLRRNRGAVFGLAIIGLALIVALFAYQLAPDSSPYANRMIVEIDGQSPGFTMQFLRMPVEQEKGKAGLIQRWLYGVPDTFQYIPILSSRETATGMEITRYIDEETSVVEQIPRKGLTVEKKTFYLGTDKYGRDILSRLIVGVRVSLSVGLVTVLISLTLGLALGALAGYYRGKVDEVIMWFINVLWSIPTLLLVFAITLLLGKGFWQVLIAIGLTMWVNVARMVRGQILSVREMEYVEAARALGYSNNRILFRHILPNVMGPVWVVAASNFASAIVIEAGLSFLGIGVQPPQPSWGFMIKENYNFIITNNPMLALAPGFAIMLLVLAFNLLGNGLRDALSVK
jgi:ABC-type dipeptide/oligopeptide/nickel transport system permease subunit